MTTCSKCGYPLLPKHEMCPKRGAEIELVSSEELSDIEKSDREIDLDTPIEHVNDEFEQRKREDERQFALDEHQLDMENRREQQRQQRTAFDFDREEHRKVSDFDRDEQKKAFDFDREEQRKASDFDREERRKASDFDRDKQKRTLDFDFDQRGKETDAERSMRLSSHAQDMADREARRRQEELEQKGNIAMRNMQAMMEAKRAARQDELQHEKEMQQSKFEAEERRMQTQKEMTAEQIMAAQIREMDAGAQAKFAESFSAGKDAVREREVAEEKERMYDRMMQQMTEMAKMGFQANANVATGRIDALRENLAPASPTPPSVQDLEKPRSVRLNTAWLRQHGYEGSFNELAGQLANLGGDISQDYDEEGNPVIVVNRLADAQVMDVLTKTGVRF